MAKKKAKIKEPAWFCDIQYIKEVSAKENKAAQKRFTEVIKKREKQLDEIISLLKKLLKAK